MNRSAIACGRAPDPELSGCRSVPADANILQWYKLYRRRLAEQREREVSREAAAADPDERAIARRLPIAAGRG